MFLEIGDRFQSNKMDAFLALIIGAATGFDHRPGHSGGCVPRSRGVPRSGPVPGTRGPGTDCMTRLRRPVSRHGNRIYSAVSVACAWLVCLPEAAGAKGSFRDGAGSSPPFSPIPLWKRKTDHPRWGTLSPATGGGASSGLPRAVLRYLRQFQKTRSTYVGSRHSETRHSAYRPL
jgi:hypothetical protein